MSTGTRETVRVRTAQLRARSGQLWQTAEQTLADLNAAYPALTGMGGEGAWTAVTQARRSLAACDARLTGLVTELDRLSRSMVSAADAYDDADRPNGRRVPVAALPW